MRLWIQSFIGCLWIVFRMPYQVNSTSTFKITSHPMWIFPFLALRVQVSKINKHTKQDISHRILYSAAEHLFTFDYTYKSTLVNKLWNDGESSRFYFNTKIIIFHQNREESIHTCTGFSSYTESKWFGLHGSVGNKSQNESHVSL